MVHAIAARLKSRGSRAITGPVNVVPPLQLCDAATISSMSTDWIERQQASGRFSTYTWSSSEHVAVTTLDRLIAAHGVPDFCKIDVEGYELEVLKGLSQPIPALSFEFTPEHMHVSVACIQHLCELGDFEFSWSMGESMLLAGPWQPAETLVATLAELPDPLVFGDVYARLSR